MYQRILGVFLLVLAIASCDFFPLKKKEPLQVLDTVLDYHSVDNLPLFASCDSLLNKEERTACFRKMLYAKISTPLLEYQFVVSQEINDTVLVDLLIDNKGKTKLLAIHASELVNSQLPVLDSLIKQSIDQLPLLHPAIKRGIPVATKYSIPILVRMEVN